MCFADGCIHYKRYQLRCWMFSTRWRRHKNDSYCLEMCDTKLTPQYCLKQFNLHEKKTCEKITLTVAQETEMRRKQSNHNHWLNVFEWGTTFTTMLKSNTILIMWYSRNNMFKKQLYLFSVSDRLYWKQSYLLCISHSFAPILISQTHTNPSPPPLTIFQSSACTEVTPKWWAYRDATEEPDLMSNTLTLRHSKEKPKLILSYWEKSAYFCHKTKVI